jgi:hypothetical protein
MGPKRLRFRFHGFRCQFRCRSLFKTPGGAARHALSCSKNPANFYNPPPSAPPSLSQNSRLSHTPPPGGPITAPPSHTPSHTPPRTPGLFCQDSLDFPPHTPAPHNNAPVYESPRRIRWTQKGKVKIRIHPYLDGELFV